MLTMPLTIYVTIYECDSARARQFLVYAPHVACFATLASLLVFLGHLSSLTFVDEIAKRAIEAGDAVSHYLDDFDYYGNTPSEVRAAHNFCRSLFKQAGYQINFDQAADVSQEYVSLGIRYNLVEENCRYKLIFCLRSASSMRSGPAVRLWSAVRK